MPAKEGSNWPSEREAMCDYWEVAAPHVTNIALIADSDGSVVWVSTAFEKLTGNMACASLGKRFDEFLRELQIDPKAVEQLCVALEEGKKCHVHTVVRSRSEKKQSLVISLAPQFLPEDELLHFVVISRKNCGTNGSFDGRDEFIPHHILPEQHAIVSVIDEYGKLLSANEAFYEATGFAQSKIIGRHHPLLNSAHDEQRSFEGVRHDVLRDRYWKGEMRGQRADGQFIWALTSVAPISEVDASTSRFVCVQHDITKTKQTEIELRQLAERDALTSLVSRRFFLKKLSDRAKFPTVSGSSKAVVVVLDLDHFKNINDAFGYDAGDEVLVQIAARLEQNTGTSDVVARLGGDEFGIILTNPSCTEAVKKTIMKLHDTLSQSMVVSEHLIEPGISIGVSQIHQDGTEAEDLLRSANAALSAVKRNGRGHWQVHDGRIGNALVSQQNLVTRLGVALEHDEIEVAFQPQVNLRNGDIRGFEALIRWSPNGAIVPPSKFIPAIEQEKIIIPIGACILNKSVSMFARLRDMANSIDRVSVNVAPRQLWEPDFVRFVREVLDRHAVAPENLEIELTETALIGPWSEKVKRTLIDLNSIGVSIALDDFGTGYSSLTDLKAFPVNALKIDKSLTQQVVEHCQTARFVRAVISFSRELGLETIAEGVETRAQDEFLKRSECNVAQGYYYHRPFFLHAASSFVHATNKGEQQGPGLGGTASKVTRGIQSDLSGDQGEARP